MVVMVYGKINRREKFRLGSSAGSVGSDRLLIGTNQSGRQLPGAEFTHQVGSPRPLADTRRYELSTVTLAIESLGLGHLPRGG
jgi:hypothetical protein